jgi:DNA-binding transcriptional LysR family regulator
MDTKWLEDFISLAQTQSFSRSAQARNVTQPAFSRRIQSLESWLSVELIDRSAYPTRLTPAGEVFYEQALQMLEQLRHARAMAGARLPDAAGILRLAVPHLLALTAVPAWLSFLREQKNHSLLSNLRARLTAHNVHDAVSQFVEGGSDLLICYFHSKEPIELDPTRYEWKLIGTERFAAYSALDKRGKPKYKISHALDKPTPLLAYSANAYFARMLDAVLTQGPPVALSTTFETDMAESLKYMAIEGHGVAWLPESTTTEAVKQERLVKLPGVYELTMEIRLFREKLPFADPVKKQLAFVAWDLWPTL